MSSSQVESNSMPLALEELLDQGIHNLNCKKYSEAIDQLQEVCRIVAEKFGERAEECAEVYLYYGMALFGSAKMDYLDCGCNTVLGNVLTGKASQETSQEAESTEVEEEVKTTEEDEEEEGTEETTDTADSEEDISDLQLAWEMLQLSKMIFKNDESYESKLKQADCLLLLGEIGLLTEQFTQAISDFCECIALLEKTAEKSSRQLAAAHYQIAAAYGYVGAFDEALIHYLQAFYIIELKITELRKMDSDDQTDSARLALEELFSVIPVIEMKIVALRKAQEINRQSFRADANGEQGASSAFKGECSTSSASPSASDKLVQNIAHPIREKRKLDEEEFATGSGDKKTQTESSYDMVSSECDKKATTETDPMETSSAVENT